MKFPLLGHIAIFSYFIPAIIAAIRWKSIPKKYFFFLLCIIFNAVTVGLEYYCLLHKINNHYIANIHVVIESILVLIFYYQFSSKGIIRLFLLSFMIVMCIGSVYLFITQTFLIVNSTVAITSRLAIILFSIIVLQLEIISEERNVLTLRLFWITTGFVVYCTGNVFVLGFYDFIIKSGVEYIIMIWSMSWILDIVGNSFFCIGMFNKNNE